MPATLKNNISLQSQSPVDRSGCGEQLPDDVQSMAQAEDVSGQQTKPFSQPRNHLRLLVMRGLIARYGPNGPDYGVTEERRNQEVNEWVRNNGAPQGVSKATIRRAIRELRASGSRLSAERS